MDDQSSRAAVKTSSNNNKKKKTAGSDLSSARGSEDRQSLPPTGRGTKRGRDNEIEKVSKKPRAPPKSEAKIDNPAPGPSAVSPPKAAVRHSTRTRKPTAKATLDSKGPRPLRAKASATKRPNEVQEQGAGPSEKVQNGASKEVQEVQEQGSGPSGKVQNGAPKDAHKPREGSLCLVVAGYPLDNPPQGLSKKANGQQTRRQTRTRAEEERAADEDELQEEQYNARPAVKIECPDLLKGILVDDWEHVTRDLQILSLPAKHPVREILDTYFEEEKGKRRLGSAEADLLEEMVAGMKQYFDKTLGKMLLYRFEREQYFRIRQAMDKGDPEFKDKAIGDIYGPEFLARLFGKSGKIARLLIFSRNEFLADIHSSLSTRTHRPDKHGRTIRPEIETRSRRYDALVVEECKSILRGRVRDTWSGVFGPHQGQLITKG